MMPRSGSPDDDNSKQEGDSRRERSMSISSRNSSSDREHSSMPYKKRRTESHERFSTDGEKSRSRSVRSLYRHDDRNKSKGGDYSGSDFENYRDSILDMEDSVDPSICNFRGSTLQNDTLEHRRKFGDDRLRRLEKVMAKIVQKSRTPSEQRGRHYGTHEYDRDHSNSRLKKLEKMIEKIVRNKTETPTFIVQTDPNGLAPSVELIPRNSNFTTSMWLNKINEECLERSFDEKTCIKFLESKMTGSVKSWYKTLGSNDLTWPELKMLITQTFPDNYEFASTLRLLVNRFKKPSETITQYYFSKMYLIEACRISGVYAVSCLIDGLRDPEIQRDAKANNFLTPESLYSHYLNKLSNHDEPNHKGEMDGPNHKGEMDGPNHKGEMDGPNHKDKMDKPNLKCGVDLPNNPNEHEKGHLVQSNPPKEHPNHPKVDPDVQLKRPTSPNHKVGQPYPPNYRKERSNFRSHHNFDRDYGMPQPHPPNFRMGPNYGMEPWHPDPYFDFEYPRPSLPPRYIGEPPEMPIPSCDNCNNVGHFTDECWTKCYSCHKRGHISSICPNQKEEPAKKKNPKESEKAKNSVTAKNPEKPKEPGK